MWISSAVVWINLYSESLPSLGVLTAVSMFANSVWLACFIYDIGTRQKACLPQLKYFLSLFPCFTNIAYECSGLRPLYYLCFEFHSITSTLHFPNMHQNSWSDNVLPPHYHVLKWLQIAFLLKCGGDYVHSVLLNPISEYLSYHHKI